MSLAYSDTQTGFGTDGSAGRDGRDPTVPGTAGGAGASGRAGGLSILTGPAEAWEGTGSSDSATFQYTSLGGHGGAGGRGGNGAFGTLTSTTVNTPRVDLPPLSTTTSNGGPGGEGGAAGAGGRGGTAEVLFGGLIFTGIESIQLGGTAYGGAGASGGAGGGGGNTYADWYQVSYWPTGFGDYYVESVFTQSGGPGGDAGVAGQGGKGGFARAGAQDISVGGEAVTFRADFKAYGGSGGQGGGESALSIEAGRGGTGAEAGLSADGGAGGAGGGAQARLTGLALEAGSGQVTILLTAFGGTGGAGGTGGPATYGASFDIARGGLEPFEHYGRTYVAGGDGGDGGAGGRAVARFDTSTIAFTGEQADYVQIALSATGGMGGAGGTGASPVFPVLSDDGYLSLDYSGAPAGAHGLSGLGGVGRVAMHDVTVELGGGDDVLHLQFEATGAGTELWFARNVFDGGLGLDTLTLVSATWAATVNVLSGFLRFGDSRANTLTGFEQFLGTALDDSFVDGAGDQTYSGGDGADSFLFRSRHGHDRIEDLQPWNGDLVILRGLGTRLDSFEEVLARATETASGVVIATGAGSSLTLANLTLGDLNDGMFGFA